MPKVNKVQDILKKYKDDSNRTWSQSKFRDKDVKEAKKLQDWETDKTLATLSQLIREVMPSELPISELPANHSHTAYNQALSEVRQSLSELGLIMEEE